MICLRFTPHNLTVYITAPLKTVPISYWYQSSYKTFIASALAFFEEQFVIFRKQKVVCLMETHLCVGQGKSQAPADCTVGNRNSVLTCLAGVSVVYTHEDSPKDLGVFSGL